MIFCEHCFNDFEVKNIIRSNSTLHIGNCPICGHSQSYLYDTDIQSVLTPYFEELLDIYTTANDLPTTYPIAETRCLIDDLQNRWNIFSNISRSNMLDILKSICNDKFNDNPNLFINAVGIAELYDKTYLENHALLKYSNWTNFVNKIKTENRYHSKFINFEILEKYCSFIRKAYKKDSVFYRARISEQNGFTTNEMSAPPAGKSSEGRANARGITCLYLANNIETTLHEVRAGIFDYVSVGEFVLKQDIVVVNLRAITEISPFIYDLDYLDHAINKQYLEKLNSEMSKSLRRSDSTLDYVPTQYIVDFIKSIEHDNKQEYDGIEYNSTINPGGYNLAIFNPNLFECVKVNVYKIDKLQYTYSSVLNQS